MSEEPTRIDVVRDYYAADPDREWTRLQRHPFERPVTMHFLEPHLPQRARILDVGGGPGRYALALVQMGHAVTLVDITPELLAVARRQAQVQDVDLGDIVVGDARDLGGFPDSSFDVVLCFGPLYHLRLESERAAAVTEAIRVAKPGAVVAFAFISIVGVLNDAVRRCMGSNGPERITDKRAMLERLFRSGVHRVSEDEPGFTDSAFINPAAVQPFLAQFGLQQLASFGAERSTGQSESILARLSAEALDAWIEIAKLSAPTQAGLHGSDHIVCIARTPL